MNKVTTVALALLLGASAWGENWKLVGGAGLGPMSLGQPYTNANKFLTPLDANGDQRHSYLRYKEGVDLECDDLKITQIVVRKQSFSSKGKPVNVIMDGNVHVGSTIAEMEAALGRDYQQRTVGLKVDVKTSVPEEVYYAYANKGLGFLTKMGKITEIAVWRRR